MVEGYEEEGRTERSDGFLPAGAPRPAAVRPPESPADRPPDEEGELRVRGVRLLPLSGKAEGALRALARAYLSWLDERAGELDDAGAACSMLADMAWTACVGRSHFNFRAGLVFHDIESLRDGLKTVAEADEWPQSPPAAKVAFAFTGEGSEWVGMGKGLYDSEPAAREVLDRCDAALREERGESLLDVTFGSAAAEKGLDDPAWTQPALYALECAIAALWASVGIRPGAVVGQGIGEVAAAQAAGVFSLEDGLRIAAAQGGNKPLEGIPAAPPALALVSSITGKVMAEEDATEEAYWPGLARGPVAIDRCVKTLTEMGVQVVLEIGPEPVLGPEMASAWPESAHGSGGPVVLSSLRRNSLPDAGFVSAVGGAYQAGQAISFERLFAGEARRRVSLPGYPFQRRRHWIEDKRGSQS